MRITFMGYDAELEAQPATIVIDLPLGKVTVEVPVEWDKQGYGSPFLRPNFDKAMDAVHDAQAEGIA